MCMLLHNCNCVTWRLYITLTAARDTSDTRLVLMHISVMSQHMCISSLSLSLVAVYLSVLAPCLFCAKRTILMLKFLRLFRHYSVPKVKPGLFTWCLLLRCSQFLEAQFYVAYLSVTFMQRHENKTSWYLCVASVSVWNIVTTCCLSWLLIVWARLVSMSWQMSRLVSLCQTDLSLSHWVHFTVLRCICVFVFSCISLHACCIIVTRWGRPGGIEAWSNDWPSSFSALTLLVGSHDL